MEATDATYDVWIVEFDSGHEAPAARLQRAFGIDAERAATLIATLPAPVQRGISRVRADYFSRALRLIGAHVELRDEHGRVIAAAAPEPASGTPARQDPKPVAPQPVAAGTPVPDAAAAPVAAGAALHDAWIDPRSRTLVAGPPPDMPRPDAPHEAPAAAHDTAFDLRPPAHPTVREVSALRPDAAQLPTPLAPAPAPVVDDVPAPTWLRIPSSVRDPPPASAAVTVAVVPASPAALEATAPAAASAASTAMPAIALDPVPQAAVMPAHGGAPARAAAESFDIGKSVLGQALWRPAASQAPVAALTLDDEPAVPMRLLAPWELPSGVSISEPNAAAAAAESPAEKRLPARGKPARPPIARRAVAAPAAGRGPDQAERAARPVRPAQAAAPQVARVGLATRGPSASSLARADLRSFWDTVPEALLLPFGSFGIYWLLAIGAWSVAVGVFAHFASYALFVSLPIVLMALNSTLAFACDYYRVCLWAPASGEKHIDRKPDFEPVRLFHGYIRSGMHLFAFMIVSQVPLIWWFLHNAGEPESAVELLLNPITWLLWLFPYFYWPMGVGLTALGNDFAAIWNVPAGLRVIMRLPLEYCVIVFVGVLAFGFSLLSLLIFGQFLGVTGILISGSVGLPLAISHGVQGALMGHLVRAHAEAFE